MDKFKYRYKYRRHYKYKYKYNCKSLITRPNTIRNSSASASTSISTRMISSHYLVKNDPFPSRNTRASNTTSSNASTHSSTSLKWGLGLSNISTYNASSMIKTIVNLQCVKLLANVEPWLHTFFAKWFKSSVSGLKIQSEK